jgi:hypothetical protein
MRLSLLLCKEKQLNKKWCQDHKRTTLKIRKKNNAKIIKKWLWLVRFVWENDKGVGYGF